MRRNRPNVQTGIRTPRRTIRSEHSENRLPDQWRDVQRHEVNATRLKSSEELRQQLAAEFQDLIDQGLLALPAPGRKIPGSS